MNLKKKIKMKPFKFEDAKNKVHHKYCYRNGQKIIDIIVIEKANQYCNIISVMENGSTIIHQSNGSIMYPQESMYDVMIDE